MTNGLGSRVLGPDRPPVSRIQTLFIKKIVVKIEQQASMSQVDLNYIFDEYARELCGECARWYLLKRNAAFETRLAAYNKRAAEHFKKEFYLRPIPTKYLDAINNPAEFGQNAGY